MYRTILIEDDFPCLRNLKKIISGMDTEFEITASFTYPKDAIDYINKNPVDAIITDIELPEMSGIDLCKYCKEKFPEIKIALISAYDKFEYAQKAIDLEIVHYVLKPITIKKLTVMFEKLAEKLKEIKKSEGFVSSSLILNRQKTILNLLSGFYSDYSYFFEDMQKYEVSLNYENCRIAVLTFNCNNLFNALKEQSFHTKEELYNIISNITYKNGNDIFSVLFNQTDDNFIIYIFSCNSFSEEHFKKIISDYTDSLSDDIKNIFNIDTFSFNLDYYDNIDKFYKAQRKIYSYTDQAKNIISYVYDNDFDSAINCIVSLKVLFDESQVKKLYHEILLLLSNITNKEIPDENTDSDKLLNIIIGEINNIKQYNLTNAPNIDIIETACRYIQKNFANDITLNDVAKYVYLSPIYFSSYFKKKTGEKYSDYLQQVKLKKACELLKDTDVKIPTVATMSGFNDTNYFHKIFKNQTGITPLEYRNKYRRNN